MAICLFTTFAQRHSDTKSMIRERDNIQGVRLFGLESRQRYFSINDGRDLNTCIRSAVVRPTVHHHETGYQGTQVRGDVDRSFIPNEKRTHVNLM